jgi:hypothetical protein
VCLRNTYWTLSSINNNTTTATTAKTTMAEVFDVSLHAFASRSMCTTVSLLCSAFRVSEEHHVQGACSDYIANNSGSILLLFSRFRAYDSRLSSSRIVRFPERIIAFSYSSPLEYCAFAILHESNFQMTKRFSYPYRSFCAIASFIM